MQLDSLIRNKLESARKDLLELSTRNRLLNTPRHSSRSRSIEVVDELAEQVFRILVRDRKAMSFLAAKQADQAENDSEGTPDALPQPEDDEIDEQGIAKRHTDNRLQTTLSSEVLQKRLLRMHHDARTFVEEQGVNILYLAIGFLKWYEDESSDRVRYAPLLLIPVALERQSAATRFMLRRLDDEITVNLSLQTKLKADFGVDLPDVPELEDLSPGAYFDQVAEAAALPRWEVLRNDAVLSFFSFSKFLMYHDLDPDNWPDEDGRRLDRHPLLAALLSADGFRHQPVLCGENEHVDGLIPVHAMIHVVDADSSQAVAIEEARRDRNLVVQGPPGTGKSQTIANMIATAVKDGRKVLFVAEKMAALEVVKRRLDKIDLGDMCLELHSHKANKRTVLEDLRRTMDLGCPDVREVQQQAEQLQRLRDQLNLHAQAMHEPFESSGVTPYRVVGALVELMAKGVRPTDFFLDGAERWVPEERRARSNLVGDIATHIGQMGVPAEHPWRGVMVHAVLPTDVRRLAEQLPSVTARLEDLIAVSRRLAALANDTPPTTAFQILLLARFAHRLAVAPELDRDAFRHPAWSERRQDIAGLVRNGITLRQSRAELEGVAADVAWTTDVSGARRALAAYGTSWFRWVRKDYRGAVATLRGVLQDTPPKDPTERIAILDTLIAGQAARAGLERDDKLGQQAFGELWQREGSNWSALQAVDAWDAGNGKITAPQKFREALSRVDDAAAVGETAARVAEAVEPALQQVRALFETVQLDLDAAFGANDLKTIPLSELVARLGAWSADTEGISKWVAYRIRWHQLRDEGMAQMAQRLHDGRITPAQAIDQFTMAYYEAVMHAIAREQPHFAAFNGQSHDRLVAQFKKNDTMRIKLARQQVAFAHHDNIPRGASDIGEMGIIRREMQKKRRHLPLRQLLKQAGTAVQAIKPVFMMSPMSIAQYLEPGRISFDLLLIDEASQMRPVDAFGAVARTGQIVVVGDDKQLPPTRFFERMVASEDGSKGNAENFQAADVESILGLCVAQNMPQRMLRWHYRSRHESLIAVSNREFYDNRLHVIPSSLRTPTTVGLRFRHVPDGVYDRGGSQTNRAEAHAVAQAVMEHACAYPDVTLGVGAFSVKQRDAIMDELELLLRAAPDVQAFFAPGKPEPFFIKNLENIQGDEREVIYISVGYGRDASGYMAMSFGPLSADGGERRLNVLITRARQRCEVFSSITADDIDLARVTKRGPEALKTFLSYAATKLLDVPKPGTGDYDSPFEREVARALEQHGYRVDAQVGMAGFFVDLAVIDPDKPGRYLLGIECDGASYHSSRSARDRDRLRQQVLEDRGWIIHRIWSTDWFHRPEEQLRKTLAAIEKARAEVARNGEDPQRAAMARRAKAETDNHRIERATKARAGQHAETRKATRYREASFDISTATDIHEVPVSRMAQIVTKIVAIEGPVHEEEVARRVAHLWDLRRTGSRIVEAVLAGLEKAEEQGSITGDGRFYTADNRDEVPVRDRSEAAASTLRKPEMLPPAEIRAALQVAVEAHMGVTRDDAVVEASRLFGFKATSAQLRKMIAAQLETLLQEESLTERNGRLYAK